MTPSWRPLLIPALALALLASGGASAALDPTALEELEGLLRDLGFDPGPVDGVVDDDTTEAIRRYQDFALLPGDPEPDQRLLDELRGVAAAFAALSAAKAEVPPAPAAAPEAATPEAAAPEKVIVPPPPPPPKLTVSDVAETIEEAEAQIAALPPPTALPDTSLPEAEAADPAAELQARIDAELLRFLHLLHGGSVTPEALAREFNAEGRALLQQARYDEAIFKFSVAIHLDPLFAGAYSNRGTAYRHIDEGDRAAADFDRARELGFGGLRAKGKSNPLD